MAPPLSLTFQLNVSTNIPSLARQAAPILAHFELCPRPERLRFCYWAGRWHLMEHRVGPVS